MHVILTHEQADFDAIASQLGAALLYEGALPVLPQRLNRNVRAFISLYGADLPYVQRRDLGHEPISQITLVDTQAMISLRGMRRDTRVQVIDHHDPRPDLPESWQVLIQPTGAAATLVVEAIRQQDIALSSLQATVLLMGIYEDTGSLTYTRTTERDLLAAAYLLQQGASLNLAASFLNHPLSLAQQALYDELRQVAETHRIHGHTVLVACGDARSMDEEVSTVAHKLRDLLDPDGLFLLILIRGGVQLIARSTNDHINVADIAAQFGGGGHARASAAMIKRDDLPAVCSELLAVLQQSIRPAITVGQIYSMGPRLLRPDTPVEEASRHMIRYGYEGYPVVEDGKVVGLVTRRAVDRATSHNLRATVRQVMDAGRFSVLPTDSIETLQQVMADSGWGQVPVLDPHTNQVVGIVTRTDLLKTLAPEPTLPGLRNLADKLETALPTQHLALIKVLSQFAASRRTALYIVGGFVRDLILDRPSLDYDLVVEGEAIPLANALAEAYGGRVTVHRQFGTAKWIIASELPALAKRFERETGLASLPARKNSAAHSAPLPDALDLITARTEFYTHPSALPTVEHGSIKLDLHRRDFTINTLALRLDGRHYGDLHDYWGGLNDLQQGVIRVLHSVSFIDDPTRILRAVRFEQRFGFQIAQRTLELIEQALHTAGSGETQTLLDRVSGDRIRHELDHILTEPNVLLMFDRLAALGVLKAIHPAFGWDAAVRQSLAVGLALAPPAGWGLEPDHKGAAVRLALAYLLLCLRMPLDALNSFGVRLKIPASLVRIMRQAAALWVEIHDSSLVPLSERLPSQVTNRLDGCSPLALWAVYLCTPPGPQREAIDLYISSWRHIHPTLTGHDLHALGIPPGPVYARVLTRLRSAWLDGEINSPEAEQALCHKLLSEDG